MFTVDGLLSGLDTTAIVESALALQQSRVDRLNIQKQQIVAEQTAFQTIEGQLLGLQGSLRSILRSTNNAFDTKIAVSSNEEAVDVSASSKAVAGSYQLRVTQLAQSHQIKSNGFASPTQEIGSGTLTFRVGTRAESTITIDSSNNTLQGLADAINSLASDVSATIVNDGSNSEQPFRLLVSSRHSGSKNEIAVTNNIVGGELLDFAGPAVQDAQDAQVQIGTGAGAITVSSQENKFEDLIPGVDFDTLAADPERDVVITVSEDSERVVEAIDTFVGAYNEVIDFISANSRFDQESETAGLLLGNSSASGIQSTLRGALSTVVDGVNENLRTLTSIGITTDENGKLVLNSTRLGDIVEGRVEGVDTDDIRRLFAIDGQSDNPGIEFLLGTNNTKASPKDPATGELIPYEVEINRVASQANVVAASPLMANNAFNETNDTFRLELDGVELEIAIPHGIYAQQALAEQIQTLVNTSPDRAGREIVVSIADGRLDLSSATYGGASNITILDGNANASLRLTTGTTDVGENVAGVFRVQVPGEEDKRTEQATGSGRLLTGKDENEYTADLQIRSNLQESQISEQTDANLTVTRGIGAALDAAIDQLLEPFNFEERDGTRFVSGGELAISQNRYDREIESIDENIARVEAQIESRRASLLQEFVALESTLAELQAVGNALTTSLIGTLG